MRKRKPNKRSAPRAPRVARGRGPAQWILTLAVAITVLHVSYVNFATDAFARTIVASAMGGADPPQIATYAEIDHLFGTVGAKGNVLLRFRPSGAPQAGAEHFAEMVYYRAVYAVYPRRVYVAGASDVVNNGHDLLGLSFAPADPWLDEHRVATTITLRVDERGSVGYDVQPRVIREPPAPARRP